MEIDVLEIRGRKLYDFEGREVAYCRAITGIEANEYGGALLRRKDRRSLSAQHALELHQRCTAEKEGSEIV